MAIHPSAHPIAVPFMGNPMKTLPRRNGTFVEICSDCSTVNILAIKKIEGFRMPRGALLKLLERLSLLPPPHPECGRTETLGFWQTAMVGKIQAVKVVNVLCKYQIHLTG